jgi:SM-20-related protein
MDELTSPKLRRLFGEKTGFDLETYPPQVTVRKFMAGTDGNIHNDSRSKKVAVLIYFNEEWKHKGGQLRFFTLGARDSGAMIPTSAVPVPVLKAAP